MHIPDNARHKRHSNMTKSIACMKEIQTKNKMPKVTMPHEENANFGFFFLFCWDQKKNPCHLTSPVANKTEVNP